MRASEAKLSLLALLLLGGLLRFWFSDFKPMTVDFDPFYHARIAETIYAGGRIPWWDPLELGGIRHYYPPAYHLLMVAGRYPASGLDFVEAGSILTAFFGVLSVFLLFVLAKEEFGPRVGLTSAVLFAFAPAVVYRSGLLARPTGITIFLTIFLLYSWVMLRRRGGWGRSLVLLLAALVFAATHSSVLLALAIVVVAAGLDRDRRALGRLAGVVLLASAAGLFYYRGVIPELNLSMGFTAETRPLVGTLSPEAVPAFFSLSIYGLAALPLALHGAYVLLKSRFSWGVLVVMALSLSFFKISLFILSIFIICVAMAVSLEEIRRFNAGRVKVGWSLSYLILFMVLAVDGFTLYELHGTKVNDKVGPLSEFLADQPIPEGTVVLANDVNVGHGIAYYSNASTFMSDLTDVKRWNENLAVYQRLAGENLDPEEAMDILAGNRIGYLLIFERGDPFPFLERANLRLVKREDNISLYRVK